MVEDILEQRQLQAGPAGGGGQANVGAAEPPPVTAQPDLPQHRRPGLLDADPGGAGQMLAEHGAIAALGPGVERPAEAAQLVKLAQHQRRIEQGGVGCGGHGAMVTTAFPPANREIRA